MLTCPQLFAAARGVPLNPGGQACFFCSGICDESHAAADYVADSFTERNSVSAPASRFVCAGCVEAMRSDVSSVPLIDGSTQRPKEGKRPTLQVRWFSWLVTEREALAATPGHRDRIAQTCLSPPEPPYAICIADGNKHHLYRTPVNYSRDRIAVNCEGVRVDYHPEELTERMALVMRLVAACGKGSNSLARLYDPNEEMSVALQLANHYSDAADLLASWIACRNQPLSDLALFLTPGKEECLERIGNSSPAALGAV